MVSSEKRDLIALEASGVCEFKGAASYVAMAGDAVIMPENACLMIHDPAGMVMCAASDKGKPVLTVFANRGLHGPSRPASGIAPTSSPKAVP